MKRIQIINLLNIMTNEKVILSGFVSSIRKIGNLNFVILRDESEEVQLIINSKIDFTKESVIEIEGTVLTRKDPNPKLKLGNIEIQVNKYQILSKSKELPFDINDKVNVKEETKLKHRYLDLRTKKMQHNIRLRSKLINAFREFLNQEDFVEVETPILSKSTPEGARDYLVQTREKDSYFALPQSPQIYKQLLMLSGFEKYYQVAKVFRDEDLRKDRQPEFTQLDIEMAFADEETIFNLSENLFKYAFNKIGIKLKTPFQRMSFDEAIDKYGSDKPDIRFDYLLNEATNYFAKVDLDIFKDNVSTKYLVLDKLLTNKEIKEFEEIALKNKAPRLIAIKIEKGTYSDNKLNNLIKDFLDEVIKKHKINSATIFIVSGNYKATTQSLGALRVKINEKYELTNPNEYKFLWVVDFPLFEEEDGNLIAMHHPFTQPSSDSIKYLENNELLKAKARAYDLTLNGFELSSGSVRISNKDMQSQMFKLLNLSQKEIDEKFGFFVNAFNYGVPPHAGVAFGIDRIMMILVNSLSIRDVIAFPKNNHGVDVLFGAPSKVKPDNN